MKQRLSYGLPVILLLFLSVRVFGQDVYSLGTKVTLKASGQTADVVLKQLGRQTGYSFSFDADALKRIVINGLDEENVPLGRVLRTLGASYGFDFVLIDKTISVRVVARAARRLAWSRWNGRVTDAANGQPLAGADVTVRGSRESTITGADGRFSMDVQEESPEFVFSMIGYKIRSVHPAGPQEVAVSLAPDVRAMGSVVVEARKRVNTEASLLNERKNAAVVSDGISAQQIEKTASITTTQALQRVAGVTITDDKYVAIRGLGDRAVIAELNGARLSSANPDRSAVPLDLVPAGLLDNITVYKTLTPDHPADASAGIIELKTKSIPDSLTVQFTVQGGFNSTVGLAGQYNGFYHDNLGFWGQRVKEHNLSQAFLNLNQQYPGGLIQIQEQFINSRQSPQATAEAYRINSIMQSFDPVLTTSYQKAAPNQIYAATIGNDFRVFHGHSLGVILSGSYYQRTEDIYNGELNQYSLYQGVVTGSPAIYSPMHIPNYITPDFPRLGKFLSYQESTGKVTLNYGVLAGVAYRFNRGNDVQFQYMGSRGAEAQGSNLTGAWDNTGLNYPVYNVINQLHQTYRVFNTFNLQGEHRLLGGKWTPHLSYNLSSSRSVQNEPDFRFTDLADLRTTRYVDPNGVGIGSDTYAFVFGTVHGLGPSGSEIGADPNGRRYRKLVENNYNAKADLAIPFTIHGLNQELKFGGNYLKRDRTFSENILGLPGTNLGGDNGLLNQLGGDLNALVSYQNIGLKGPSNYDNEGQPRVGGFLYQIRKSPNNYTGTYETDAFYGMADLHLTKQLRLIGGVRFESTDIQAHVDTNQVFNPVAANPSLQSAYGGNLSFSTSEPNTGYSTGYKPYYSANLVYTYHKNMNFRVAYSTSLARPELREITDIYEFDPFQFAVVVGNPSLVNQLTKSADFRWEWFPRAGEVFSASVFGKRIEHQLTKVFIYNSQGNQAKFPEFPIVEFQNDPNIGVVYGVELEARKDLGAIWPGLAHVFFGSNLLLAASSIDKNPERLNADRTNDRFSPATSPVFEQAPYSINAYVDYVHPRWGTDVTVSFNIVGERLVQVQLDGTPDIYDRPMPTLDFVFSQRLGKRWLAKGFAKNLLNPPYREVYADPGNNGQFHGITYVHHQYYKGSELALGLTYNLF
ncbi:TonB-dependent receptor domain-containing protein [Dinghuibacter silviterrae]|uniref:TonB-dependent receptor n=1 Tax=Dinghuibacter silviterrae TaxID=1539049 RepID=A0A4R8DI60_9BACT|nr:TonB-dependent receptor [Dinghuibacter silviterrae]TDW97235.1 TonB-dependent receptor [Dinghuibacter silviterrae]